MKQRPVQFALFGLACAMLAVWQSFEAGPVVQTRQVTITFVHDVPMYEPPSRTSFRASGAVLPGRTVRDYQVGCVTPEGVRCTVVTDPQAMLPVYRVGDWTTADVEIFKPAGTFGWTFNSQLLAWPAAFAFALAAFQWRRRRDIPIAVPPAPTFAVAREELIGRRLLSIRGYQQANVEDLTPICGWRSKHSRSAVVRLKHWRKSKRLAMSRS